MKEISHQIFNEERAIYGQSGVKLTDCTFDTGESPVKECRDVMLDGCLFKWKYPIWYSENIAANGCAWEEGARAGVWYNKNVTVENAVIRAPKNFRRSSGLTLRNVTFTNAEETLWNCDGVTLENVSAKGHYFGMNCTGLKIDGLELDGNYAFDGVRHAEIANARLLTKDSFWNCEDVTVRDSFITGEYLGWNSKNLTFINCTVESRQGMCYIDDLVMKNCKLINTTLAFEYSTVEADISSRIESVLNPTGGRISAPEIGELIIERDRIDPSKVRIECSDVQLRSDRLDWERIIL